MTFDLDDEDLRFRNMRVDGGPYLGDISALAFVPFPSYPLLLAGTGSQLLLYRIESGQLLNCFQVFQGIRVHGITLRPPSSLVAVYGERRVKLFLLRVGTDFTSTLELLDCLPVFDHWILDAFFFKDHQLLAVGLSDNSVALWDLSTSQLVTRVKSPDKCLLYSMRMWGNSAGNLLVASGTIFNQILVWKLNPPSPSVDTTSFNGTPISRLIGHEGSIFRIAWSSDGTKLMSVSDDRSARIWTAVGNSAVNGCIDGISGNFVSPDLSLYGHSARIWDCCMAESIVITAGEDCTCRAWSMDGQQFMTIKEHAGRGIWRCLYDPECSLLVTAGFDSALKVHQVPSSMQEREQSSTISCFEDCVETFTLSAPRAKEQPNLMDSKSEYVRCIKVVRESIIYVATNKGYLYHVNFSSPSDVEWIELTQVHDGAQIICMDVISVGSLDLSSDVKDLVALGDGKGNVTIVGVVDDNRSAKLSLAFSWPAERERQLLVVFWCKSIGASYLFTSDPKGVVKLWKTMVDMPSDADGTLESTRSLLLAEFTSPFKQRIMCIDASLEAEVLFCGDKRGNIIVFPLTYVIVGSSSENLQLISSVDHFKGAHGISSVTNICISKHYFDHVEIHTTGGDGCICYFEYSKCVGKVEFIGMKQVKDLSTIQSVFCPSGCVDNMPGQYAVGFTSIDFIVWDLVNETKVVQVPCGGWRRPYSYHLGAVAKYQYCFAFVKDHIIQVHRLWMLSQEKLFPQTLHMQYHGREIHSLCILDLGILPELESKPYIWIVTGSEDGTVRLTRYSPFDTERWAESKLLGEHVGGSAVRSICFIPKAFEFKYESYTALDRNAYHHPSADTIGDCLLISVGSKQVLTSWILRRRTLDSDEAGLGLRNKRSQMVVSDSNDPFSSMNFQWLSTHMQPKSASAIDDNDLRYLAVTAFLLNHVDSRLTVCFVVVSCSDCTLILRALLLPYRLWFDVALLAPTMSLVLSLQNIVVSRNSFSKGDSKVGNAYIVISGSTDGSITFWDLTEAVEEFMQQVLESQPEKLIDCQRRPKTGRGSQGGRRWKSLANLSSENTSKNKHTDENDDGGSENVSKCSTLQNCKSLQSLKTSSPHTEQDCSSIHSSMLREVQPLYALTCVHQSGVNCLHIAELAKAPMSQSEIKFCLVSGGDDQALHILGFSLTFRQLEVDFCSNDSTDSAKFGDQVINNIPSGDYTYHEPTYTDRFKILFQNKILAAHSSAVKGIWTDGLWAFSTGLDQRIRCWQINKSGELSEHLSMVVSVPEPEALTSVVFDKTKNSYQIAVAGRGMQMVVFSANS